MSIVEDINKDMLYACKKYSHLAALVVATYSRFKIIMMS
jgi:hypothetical protein